jgi:peptidoglycan-associated lipoprotein
MNRLVPFLCAISMAACGSSEERVEHPQPGGEVRTVKQMPTAASTETATGDLREALLSLQRVHFALDSYSLTDDARTALSEAAEKLRSHEDVALYVQGHADERGTAEYNLGLGERRGRAVADHLTRLGIGADRLSVVSYGEELPLVAGSDQSALAANRRVDFRLMRGEVQIVLEESQAVNDRGQPIQGGEGPSSASP